MWILHILIFNLVIVLATELSAGFCMGMKTAREIATVLLINIITNPLVVLSALCLTLFFHSWQHFGVVLLEIAVVFAEGFMFARFNIFTGKNPYLCSLTLNVLSFLSGEIINIFL